MSWIVASILTWALDWWSTAHAIGNGAFEANPIAAHFHTYIGIHWYAVAILPLILFRAAIARMHTPDVLYRIARDAARFFIVVHVGVVLNNFYVIATL